ncbi:MAG: 1-acyl-sn-glycerol-3-phosphate acyltransferase [Bacteroidetes bacterium]|nr:1-acyl-sn-glycerol-3-phosphate acyltransferase [Bacteroidota bacterium]
MKLLKKCLQVVYVAYAVLLFTALLLIIFPFTLLASLAGRIKGGNIIYAISGYWADTWLLLTGIWVRKTGNPPPAEAGAHIFLANHISYMDIPMFVKTLRMPIRALANAETGRIPVFGFLYKRAAVMVDRSSAANRARSVHILKSVLRKGVSIFIFPEGMLNTTGQPLKTFYDGAFRIAIETQTPLQPMLFPDTVRRLHYSSLWSLTPGISRVIFLPVVEVKGLTTDDVEALKEKVYVLMEDALKKYN